jgi:hypothetical protein
MRQSSGNVHRKKKSVAPTETALSVVKTDKSVIPTNLSVKATDKSIGRTVFGRLEQKPFLVAQLILFFGVIMSNTHWTI